MNTTLRSIEYCYSNDGSVHATIFNYFDGTRIWDNPIFTINTHPDYSYSIIERETGILVYTSPPEPILSLMRELVKAGDWQNYVQSDPYCRKMTARMHAAIHEELIKKACTPDRLFQWHEGAAEQFPEEYLRKCAEYK